MINGHEVAPVAFSSRSSRKENQKKAAEANESFPTREKEDLINESYQRAKQVRKPKAEDGSSKYAI